MTRRTNPRVLRVLALVSSVLRDSEEVEDLALKEQVLASALALWGRLVDALEVDDDFIETVRHLATTVADLIEGASDSARERFIEGFVDTGAMLIGFAMMSTTLTTRKLLIALEHCFDRPDFRQDPGASVMGALLAYDIRGSDWMDIFRKVLADHPRVAAVEEILRGLALARYLEPDHADDNETQGLINFLADQTAKTYRGPSTPQEKQTRDQIVAGLRARRNQVEVRRRYTLDVGAEPST